MKKVLFVLITISAVIIGIYPILYLILDMSNGLLSSKNEDVLNSTFWQINFYTHISTGGIALAIGWIGFRQSIREKNIALHKNIGKVYVLSCLFSALSGIVIGYYATGGIIAQTGFMSLGVFWFVFTLWAFIAIKNGSVELHQKLMVYSYALCFAAVSLRLLMTPLILLTGDFLPAYKIVSWACWVPNLAVAWWINRG